MTTPSVTLVNKDTALTFIERIQDIKARCAIRLLIEAVEQLFRANPTELMSPFDLAFFVQILNEMIAYIGGVLDGSREVVYMFDDYPWPLEVDPARDVVDTGIRPVQA